MKDVVILVKQKLDKVRLTYFRHQPSIGWVADLKGILLLSAIKFDFETVKLDTNLKYTSNQARPMKL